MIEKKDNEAHIDMVNTKETTCTIIDFAFVGSSRIKEKALNVNNYGDLKRNNTKVVVNAESRYNTNSYCCSRKYQHSNTSKAEEVLCKCEGRIPTKKSKLLGIA